MKISTYAFLAAAISLFFLFSCQREVPDVLRTNSDSTANGFRLTGFRFYVLNPFFPDSSFGTIEYRDSLKEINVIEDDANGNRGRLFKYDGSGRWVSEKISDNGNYLWTNLVNRAAGGQLQNFAYTIDLGAGPQNYTSPFSYNMSAGNTTITFNDVGYHHYNENDYYTAFFDANKHLIRKEYLDRNAIIDYTYDNQNNLIKTIETDSIFSPTFGVEIDTTITIYERDAAGNNTLFDFYKTIFGSDLAWFERDRDYFFSILNGDFEFSQGKPCTKITDHWKGYHNGVLMYDENNLYTYSLIYDADHNLTQYIEKRNGVPEERWQFTYQRF